MHVGRGESKAGEHQALSRNHFGATLYPQDFEMVLSFFVPSWQRCTLSLCTWGKEYGERGECKSKQKSKTDSGKDIMEG